MPKKLQRKVPLPKTAAVPGGGALATAGGTARPIGRVRPRVLAQFTSQLATLLDAGIPVTRSLRVLEGQLPQGPMKRISAQLVEDVEAGTPLSEAMAKHDRVFDALYTNMMRAGEAGGVQEEILNRLAGFLEKSERIKSRVIGAMAYPAVVLGIAFCVLLLVFALVIPKFKEIFQSIGGGMTNFHWTTRTVIGLGEHLQAWWWCYVLAVVLVVVVHRMLVARVDGYRGLVHRMHLRLPLFGGLVRKNLVARFARTFGTLVQSGVPHLDALSIIQASVSNVHMSAAVASVHASIREGAGIAVPMGQSGMFDDMVVNMVDVGEQTGELDRMLGRIADRYEEEVDRTVDTTFKLLEPILLVALAVVVGFIVYALLSPLLTLMQSLRR
ncbi:MAG: hypothetical protein RL148_1155 [Planctomycetota bacterium]|jgi:type IV pilus assembly protein PilC